MTDDIYFTCKKHGQLTRNQVYSHKRKGQDQKWQCKTCNDFHCHRARRKKLQNENKEKNLIPKVIIKNITLDSDNVIDAKKAAIHFANVINLNRRK